MIQERNIVLIGFMGTGKTSVGKALAKKLKRPLMDVDRLIEEKTKRKIKEIFEKEGEAYFRKIEKEAVNEVSGSRGAVITTGGGVVLDPENISALKRGGVLICLSSSAETIFKRVKNSEKRPLLNSEDKLAQIRKLLSERAPLYKVADHQMDTDRQTPEETAVAIMKLLEEDAP